MILPKFAGIPVDFILFAMTLMGVALSHNKTLVVALADVAAISVYKIIVTGSSEGSGLMGWIADLGHE